ncbi:MAG: magnesium-translocating P-type ATPase [Puniceicoccaceae bacterium]|nr:MAG: magnesium-translocating P-type ATPase [Puniceicoccaceae bacterium]
MKWTRMRTLTWLLPSLAVAAVGLGALAWGLGAWWGLGAVLLLAGTGAFILAHRCQGAIHALIASLEKPGETARASDAGFPVEWEALQRAWQRAGAQIKQVNDAQREFTANAAHELRTPLAALQVAGECALRAARSEPEALHEAVETMLEEAQRAANLVDRLLTLAQAESGRLAVETDYHALTDLVESLLEWLRPLAAEKGQTILFVKEADWSVWADPDLFRLGLENLLSNAIRYAPENSEIIVRVSRKESGGIAVEVVDEGPGIAAEDVEYLFDRFYRAPSGEEVGSGLGLPIARWGLRAFGARLEMERRLERGSIFRILCPETEWDDFTQPELSEISGLTDLEEPWVSRASPAQVLARLQSRRSGITEDEAAPRLEAHGPNRLRQHNAYTLWPHVLEVSCTPFNAVLAIALTLSLLLGQTGTAAIMGLMLLLSIGLRLWQERRSRTAMVSLDRMVALRAKVARPGTGGALNVEVDNLVPGDVVHLAPGDMIPADLRLLTASGLQVTESVLTGESFPVAKRAAVPESVSEKELPENICFMGTHVVTGGGIGVVFATGLHTRLGRSIGRLERKEPATAFQRGMTQVSWMLLRFMIVLVPLVFFLNGLFLGDWTESFLFALAVAVGLTPELLPMVVNVNLARAAVALARRGIIIKSLPAVHGIGAMDLLCLDKTGTLTEDRPTFHSFGNIVGSTDSAVLTAAYANAHFQSSVQNALDRALIEAASPSGVSETIKNWRKHSEVPFDHERRRISVVVTVPGEVDPKLVCKGAPEAVLDVCSSFREANGRLTALDTATREAILANFKRLQGDGLRLLAVAEKVLPGEGEPGIADESELVFLGWVAFHDPVRAGVREVIQQISDAGISMKILTGDHPELAANIARQVGLSGDILTGEVIRALSDAELGERLHSVSTVARLAPAEKARIIRLLHQQGHRVGFIGDGANDANALREADVGIATESAADIARDCADVILTTKDLQPLVNAIDEGRTAFGNMLKYIKVTVSSNFGNAFSVVLAGVVLPFLPMRAIQLLIQNLLYNFAQFLLPWDRVDDSFKQKPKGWSAGSIARFMLIFGPVSCIFDLLTFGVLWYGFGANSPESSALFHSGWFTVGLLTQLLVVHILRTGQTPLWRHPATMPVLVATVVAACIGLALPYTALAEALGFVALPAAFYLWVVFVLLAYGLLTQWVKTRYARHFGGVV